jgi:hypothetical protein
MIGICPSCLPGEKDLHSGLTMRHQLCAGCQEILGLLGGICTLFQPDIAAGFDRLEVGSS